MNAHPELEHQSNQKHSHAHSIETLQQQMPDSHHNIRKPSNIQGGSRDQNREWEVGHNSRYNDIDDERQLKR